MKNVLKTTTTSCHKSRQLPYLHLILHVPFTRKLLDEELEVLLSLNENPEVLDIAHVTGA